MLDFDKYLQAAKETEDEAPPKKDGIEYRVINPFDVKTKDGEKSYTIGEIATFPKDEAIHLMNEWHIWPVDRVALKIFSEVLQEHLWIVADYEDATALKASGDVTEAIYTLQEIEELKGKSKEHIELVDRARRVFPDSTIKGKEK